MIKVLSLFSGIGAFEKALSNLNIPFEVVDAVEIDKYAVKSYNAIHGTNFEPQDITTWDKDVEVDLITHGSPCFTGDTMVNTSNGFKPIKDVVIGDLVKTDDGSYQNVLNVGSDGEKDIYKLQIMGQLPIRCTNNHPFIVKQKNQKWDNKTRRYCIYYSEPKILPLSEIRHGDLVKQPKNIKSENNRKLTDEQLWILGRYVADGYICEYSRKDRPSNTLQTYICIGNTKRKYFESKIQNYKYSISEYKGCAKYRFGVELTRLIKDIDFGKCAINKHIPQEIMNLPADKLKIFLEGYLSGDGYFSENSFKATTISLTLALSLQEAIHKSFGKYAKIYYMQKPKKHIIEGRTVNQNNQYQICFIDTLEHTQYKIDDNGDIWSYVKDIKPLGYKEKIYNLEVANNHTYVVNNIATHNCQSFSVAGKQEGGDKDSGTKSSLMYETIRIVEKLKPKYVIWENVKNLLSKKHRHNFDAYLETMEQLGYINYYQVLNAKDYGLPQNRERVFTISIRDDTTFSTDEFDCGICWDNTTGFTFPPKQELKLKLKDILEDEVDEKYYLSNEIVNYFLKNYNIQNLLDINNTDDINVVGKLDIKGHDCIKRVYSGDGISPTLTDMQGGNRQPKVVIHSYDERNKIIKVDIPQIVKVRKFEVNIPKLKDTLRYHRNYTNKEIALILGKPITLVEHWFRNDECFAIPDEDVWFKLKTLLKIDTDEFDESITTFEEREGVYEKTNRCYFEDGISPTITGDSANEKVILKEKYVSKKYDEFIEKNGYIPEMYNPYNNTEIKNISPTMSTQCGSTTSSATVLVNEGIRIRKLTPLTCLRLMGFSDEDYNKIKEAGVSSSQTYKQAGNSIVVTVLEAIFKELFKEEQISEAS